MGDSPYSVQRKSRTRRSYRPPDPPYIDDVARSYRYGIPLTIRARTREHAQEIQLKIRAAERHLNKWEGYNVRTNPYTADVLCAGDVPYIVRKNGKPYEKVPEEVCEQITRGQVSAEAYFECHFHAKDPEPVGFAVMDRGKAAGLRRKSVETKQKNAKLEREKDG